MKRWKVLVAMAALPLSAATLPPTLVNPGFEQVDADGGPSGWDGPADDTPGSDTAYEFASVAEGHSGRAVVLRRTSVPNDRGYGSMAQSLDAAPYRGKRIRYRAWAKARVQAPGAFVGLWLRVDLPNKGMGFFDNMGGRPIVDGAWRAYEIEGYVSRNAERVVAGLMQAGDGEAFIDEASLEITDANPDRTGASMTPTARAYLDHALDTLRAKHINSAKADWSDLRAEAYAAAAGAKTTADTYGAISTTIGALGEKHSYFDRPRPPQPAGGSPAPNPYLQAPTGELRGRIGVVVVPALTTRTPEEQAFGRTYIQTLHRLLSEYDQRGACGWIVDLRGNTGGNMWPMLQGLAPILGPGPFGAFVTPTGERSQWVLRDGRITTGDEDNPPGFPRIRAAYAPVAVLMGPRTLSSGEMTAVAFRGRADTRFFGQPTGAYSTANQMIALSDGAALVVTTAFVEDRDGVAFTGAIPPDEITPLDQADEAAEAWLGTRGCRRE